MILRYALTLRSGEAIFAVGCVVLVWDNLKLDLTLVGGQQTTERETFLTFSKP